MRVNETCVECWGVKTWWHYQCYQLASRVCLSVCLYVCDVLTVWCVMCVCMCVCECRSAESRSKSVVTHSQNSKWLRLMANAAAAVHMLLDTLFAVNWITEQVSLDEACWLSLHRFRVKFWNQWRRPAVTARAIWRDALSSHRESSEVGHHLEVVTHQQSPESAANEVAGPADFPLPGRKLDDKKKRREQNWQSGSVVLVSNA